MLDDLDAMQAALNEAERATRKKRRKSPAPARVEITYWSQTEKRFKKRATTCAFKPSEEDELGRR